MKSRFRRRLGRHLGIINLRQYLYNKQLIAWNTFPLIDWELLDKYMMHQSKEFQLWYTKHWTNFCGITKMMKRMKLWQNNI